MSAMGTLRALAFLPCAALGGLVPDFRPPCVPLNVVSPYQSVWSCSDNLYDSWPQHWNGAEVALMGLLRVDGTTYRFMGHGSIVSRHMIQRSVTVAPTTTTYIFEAHGVELEASFGTPAINLDDDIVAASRPVTHVTFTVRVIDGSQHQVQIYYDNSAEGAVQQNHESVWWSRPTASGPGPAETIKNHDVNPSYCDIANYVSTPEEVCNSFCYREPRCVAYVMDPATQHCYLKSCGIPSDVEPSYSHDVSFLTQPHPHHSDDLVIMSVGASTQRPMTNRVTILSLLSDRIHWGHWLVATPKGASGLHTAMASNVHLRESFRDGAFFVQKDDITGPRAAYDRWPCLSVAWDLGTLRDTPVERHLTLAYDQMHSIRFFGTNMAPLWRHVWDDPVPMLEAVERRRSADLEAMARFDRDLIDRLTMRAGDKFATLLSLVYRQVIGGTQSVWNPLTKKPWVFMKEISSDGDVSTVDVIYPAFPMFQYLYPEYARLMLEPLLVYATNGTKSYGLAMPYNLPWAPHHLGSWPICDLAPSDQEQMPVEESGNMLIMIAALEQTKSNIDYLSQYWPVLGLWADYIVESLPDPGNQLCTDDFNGPSPHNTNLAAKGIVALDAYAMLLTAHGEDRKAQAYRSKAAEFRDYWAREALDGDHYRIQFDLPDTWSMKYNLLYQSSLKLSAFPSSIISSESAFYQTQLHRCGVPLDSRHMSSKTDWSFWVAALGSHEQLLAIVDAVYRFANITEDRVPLSDYYDVDTCNAHRVGTWTTSEFRARPVQGGLFAPMVTPHSILLFA